MKQTIIIITALFLILSTACTIDTGNGGSSTNNDWRTGTEAIVMSYVTDSPPSEIVSTGKIPVTVQYSNKGAYNVKDLTFHLYGFDKNILPGFGDGVKSIGAISGKDQYNPSGSQTAYVQWESGISLGSLGDVDNFKQILSITACYSYETIAIPTICIDPQKYNYVTASRCDFTIKDLGSSQGGPIAVTDIQEKAAGDQIYLEIHFANKGTGEPYLGTSDCLNPTIEDIDKISLDSVTLSSGSVKFSCNPTTLRLDSNSVYSICSGTVSSKSTYFETPLKITVSYKYRDTMPKKEVTIVNVNKH